jgi:hypothetical protein
MGCSKTVTIDRPLSARNHSTRNRDRVGAGIQPVRGRWQGVNGAGAAGALPHERGARAHIFQKNGLLPPCPTSHCPVMIQRS